MPIEILSGPTKESERLLPISFENGNTTLDIPTNYAGNESKQIVRISASALRAMIIGTVFISAIGSGILTLAIRKITINETIRALETPSQEDDKAISPKFADLIQNLRTQDAADK